MKKFWGKFALLIAITATLQVAVIEQFHTTEPLHKFEQCLAQQPDVIYFCDSSNGWIDDRDADRRPISTMLDDLLADRKVGRIDGGAYHLELYEAFVDLLIKREEYPDLLIIPINLRSFSAEWDARPSYSFAEAIQQIQYSENRVSRALAPLLKTLQWEQDATSSLAEFKQTAVWDTDRIVGSVDDFENPEYNCPTSDLMRNKFIYHYMYTLTSEHRKADALRRIAHKAAEHKLPVVFYVTPVDYTTGNEYLGERFTQQISSNVGVIRRLIADYPAIVLDWSQALDAESFSWHQYPNEHLNEQGRTFIANNLASTLASRYAFTVKPSLRVATRSPVDSIKSPNLH